MRLFLILPVLLLVISACAPQQGGSRGRVPIQFAKNPTVILALDIAQSREAQEKDAYTALGDTAADDAILFVPQPVLAKEWLKAQAPLTGTKWQPHAVYLSCDGKTGVTTGAIQWGETDGYYTTVWQYFEKPGGKGKWLWLLSHSDTVAAPLKAPEFLGSKFASCEGKAPATLNAPDEGVKMKQGLSYDQSLSWTWQYRPDQSRSLDVKIWDGEKSVPVITNIVAAPAINPR